MLIRFSCENAFCFYEETSLSLIATSDKRHPSHLSSPSRVGAPEILRAAGIYGANGHGKTKFVDAILFMKRMACGNMADPIKSLSPFKLAQNSRLEPCRFIINFRTNRADYEYGIVIQEDEIEQEWLYETEGRQESLLFSRERLRAEAATEKYIFEFGGKLKKSKSPSAKFKIESYLNFLSAEIKGTETFLSLAVDRRVERLEDAYSWFCDTLQIVKADASYSNLHIHAAEDVEFLDYLSSAISASDTGIGHLTIKQTELSADFIEKFPPLSGEESQEQLKELEEGEAISLNTADGPSLVIRKNEDGYSLFEFKSIHKGAIGDVEFDLEDESSGTRRLLDLFPMLFSLSAENKVFIVDELDRKLHPLLSYNLVEKFLCAPRGQLVFTTHTTHLLDLDLLRRDEIWLVQKKQNGSSEVYSLSDFKVRPDLDIRKGYLQGRFGGVPFVGNVRQLGWC